MASLSACVVLCTLLLFGMGVLSYTFGTLGADLAFAAVLFIYTPLFNLALVRSRFPPSTRRPSPNLRSVRLLFPVTAVLSFLLPVALLLMCPALGPSGLARHTWLLFAQLLFETIAHAVAARASVAVLARLAGTVGCIAYRIPVAKSWATSPAVPGIAAGTQALSRGIGVANAVYWTLGLCWFLIGVCIPFHLTDPADADEGTKTS